MGVTAARALALAVLFPTWAAAEGDAASYAIGGKHFDAQDAPTYRITADGRIDWYTATGQVAYDATCHSCHGPKGRGSQYGNALTDAVSRMRYFDFVDVTVNGQITQSGEQTRIMPAFGTNPKVMCRLDAIYIYLRAEAASVLTDSAHITSAPENSTAETELSECLR